MERESERIKGRTSDQDQAKLGKVRELNGDQPPNVMPRLSDGKDVMNLSS
jgi:hypothetical protein